MSPREIIFNTIGFSVNALQTITAKVKNLADTSRHQYLIPDDENGLADALFAYETFLTEGTLSGRCKNVKLALKEYYNAWSFLFDAAQSGSRTIAEPTKTARTAQQACHTRLAEILECGNGNGPEEFDAFVEALRELSEAMGENVEDAAKRSRKGCKHESHRIPYWKAAMWAKVSVSTIRRYWESPKKGMPRPPLNELTNPKQAMEDWGLLYHFIEASASEASRMNHPINFSSLPTRVKRRFGLE